VNNLPKVVTWQCPESESNLQPQGYKFGTLPLDYQAICVYANACRCMLIYDYMCVGDLTEESQLMLKIEREKLRARTDPWKVSTAVLVLLIAL